MHNQPILADSSAWAIATIALVATPGTVAALILCLVANGWL